MLYLTTDIESDLQHKCSEFIGLENMVSSSQFTDNSDYNLDSNAKSICEDTSAASLFWQQTARYFCKDFLLFFLQI